MAGISNEREETKKDTNEREKDEVMLETLLSFRFKGSEKGPCRRAPKYLGTDQFPPA